MASVRRSIERRIIAELRDVAEVKPIAVQRYVRRAARRGIPKNAALIRVYRLAVKR